MKTPTTYPVSQVKAVILKSNRKMLTHLNRKHMSQINKTVSSDIPDALRARSSAQKVDWQQHASKTSG
ncbi:BAQ_1a_G0006530.mRNA.1.CDS.1 [Saccharomyces cerevisiae]|nr:HN1_G0052220.mRNA.1.CDS.1 [Saccharomyces cerevisiae]CAI4298152.1 BAL_1a_G0006240.mRNA.1.CDS.1 [Saccharomyces cerevisiae]CAI4304287.1 BAQ_1a_G0006530.mRNA.1.CDS.1 [Saccharomyces cerevisiae]CAI4309276.1 BAM_G0006520.mRNA.1.CDS.1 [Saccharomyces cerevisiae]CAI7057574.1 BAM_G0006520.mRNA.1.CDS.1 [Saccharomyces cerevisiae]